MPSLHPGFINRCMGIYKEEYNKCIYSASYTKNKTSVAYNSQ